MNRLNYIAAEKEAKRNIEEEPKLIQPCAATVNLSKCYMDMVRRYETAVGLLLIIEKGSCLNDIDLSKNPPLRELKNDIVNFVGEDWDMRVLGYKDIK